MINMKNHPISRAAAGNGLMSIKCCAEAGFQNVWGMSTKPGAADDRAKRAGPCCRGGRSRGW